jgi:hypothetical protein
MFFVLYLQSREALVNTTVPKININDVYSAAPLLEIPGSAIAHAWYLSMGM